MMRKLAKQYLDSSWDRLISKATGYFSDDLFQFSAFYIQTLWSRKTTKHEKRPTHVPNTLWTRPMLSTSKLVRSVLAWDKSQTRQRYVSTFGYAPVCVTVYATHTPKTRPQLALNTFNIRLTRQDKVYTSKTSNESQRVGTVIFFKSPDARLAHTPMFDSPINDTYINVCNQPQQCNVRKHTFGHVRQAKNQVSLRLCTFWSGSSLDTFWIAKHVKFLHADNEDWSVC